MPRRFRRWILLWTPFVWLTLELITFPKDRPPHTGLANVLGGFFDPTVARYPAWILLLLALLVLPGAVVGVFRNAARRRYHGVLIALGLVFAVWGLLAGGLSDFTLKGQEWTHGWIFQTVAVLLVAAAAWLWALSAPERAALLTWNTHAVWKLYRSNWQGMAGLVILALFVAMALCAPFLADHATLDPNALVPGAKSFNPPGHSYYLWMGTDAMGQSVLSEFIWSTRISLVVGLMATLISTVLGAGIGIVAGYFGGRLGELLMRVTDAFLVIPWLPLAMVMATLWSKSYWLIIIIIGVTSWPGTARVVRSDALRVRQLQFIERAKAIGSTHWHIMTKHVLPNLFPLIFANTVLVVAIAILSETTLSFLGLGDPFNFSWGTMLERVSEAGAQTLWWWLLPPGIAIVLVVVAFTFIGTAFDQVLDPKLRKREEQDDARPKTPADPLDVQGGGRPAILTQRPAGSGDYRPGDRG